MKDWAEEALLAGATKAALTDVSAIEISEEVRSYCKANACGKYGTNWRCPPGAGPLEELEKEIRSYSHVLVFQCIRPIEDSFDWEGMQEAGAYHTEVLRKVAAGFRGCPDIARSLALGAGACSLCTRCAYLDGKPCIRPEDSFGSVEAYGVRAAPLVESVGMKYINGKNTVSYVGIILFDTVPEGNERA